MKERQQERREGHAARWQPKRETTHRAAQMQRLPYDHDLPLARPRLTHHPLNRTQHVSREQLPASGRRREQRRHDGKQNARQLTGRRTCSVHRMMSHRLLPARYVARCVDKLSANRGGGSHQVLQLCGPFLSFVYSAACVLICLLSSRLPHPAQSPTLRHESETQTGDAPQRHG